MNCSCCRRAAEQRRLAAAPSPCSAHAGAEARQHSAFAHLKPCSSQPASLTLQPAGKKKKKKKAKARGDDDFGGLEEGGEEGGERGGGGLPWEGSDRDYTYEELLGEGFALLYPFLLPLLATRWYTGP